MLEGEQAPAELRPHSHHAIQLTFQIRGSFEVAVAGERLRGPVTAVASDVAHGFRASGAVAFLFVAPESAVGRALDNEFFGDRPWAELGTRLGNCLNELRRCFLGKVGEDDLLRLGRKIVDELPTSDAIDLPDPRVVAMISYARNRLDDVVTLPAAAAKVGLSEGRARHLFVSQTDLPFRAYLLWLRLERAVALYAAGSTLTAAAHEAGFADSAHFSRTFRRTFGLPAAALRLHHH